MMEKRKRERRDINLVPLINIIFLLLIFFIVAGTIKKPTPAPVEMPVATSTNSAKKLEKISVTISKDEI